MGFYGLFYTLFSRILWRNSLLREFGFVKVPDLNGTWDGLVSSSFDQAAKHKASMTISQTWTQISAILKTDSSKSHSIIGAITTGKGSSNVFCYEYINEPRATAEKTLHMHRGTARLMLVGDENVLDGECYTGRDRGTYGTLHLERSKQ